jgi:hypothetical protein
MLISLLYVSTAVKLMSNEELLELLHVSHKNNASKNLTGMLVYKGGNFMQVLEGPEEDVMNAFQKIEQDERHKDVLILLKEPIVERQFADWKMAFVNMDDESIKNEPAFSEFLQDEFTAGKYRYTPHLATIMLLSFRENVR